MKPSELRVTHRDVDVEGLRMHCVELGSGPPVLLLHGFPETWWCWRYQLEPLAAAGFRVLAPDLRGFGATEKRPPYGLDTTARDVRGLLRALEVDGPLPIIGHDWGGALTWHLAAFHPELVSRACVLNCPHPAQLQRALLGGSRRQLRRSWYMFFFQLPLLPEWALTWRGGENVLKTMRAVARERAHFGGDELAPQREAMLQPGAAAGAVGWYRAAFRSALALRHRPRPYPPIAAPVTLLWGDDDAALGFDDVVPGTERFAPRLTVQRFPGVGHFPQAERPEDVNPRLIAFLRG